MMLERVISGGQAGADQAGWRAAKAAELATGGWMPKGFLTELGMRPKFAQLYGANEHPSSSYPPRTYANVHHSDATIWFGAVDSAGFACTSHATEKIGRPFFVVTTRINTPDKFVIWLGGFQVKILNVTGNRESKNPGIGKRVEAYLAEVFRLLKEAG